MQVKFKLFNKINIILLYMYCLLSQHDVFFSDSSEDFEAAALMTIIQQESDAINGRNADAESLATQECTDGSGSNVIQTINSTRISDVSH
jgi:hypothetical protein